MLDKVMLDLGNAVEAHPSWHPIVTIPQQDLTERAVFPKGQLKTYTGIDIDHTKDFVRGFITCPYSEDTANKLVENVNQLTGLNAYQLSEPLYSDSAYPVVVVATDVKLEPDGRICSRDASIWFAQNEVKYAWDAQVAETWWNVRSLVLGHPHWAHSSLFVNQHTGTHMRKILEALNNSGMFGPIKEVSLDMLSQQKRNKISETLIRSALTTWDKSSETFSFVLHGEICKVVISDPWHDGHELKFSIQIGNYDLDASGFYYADDDRITHTKLLGKRVLAEKFL